MAKLMPLSDLAPHYDGLLCDIWGVLHNGITAFPNAVDALCKYRRCGAEGLKKIKYLLWVMACRQISKVRPKMGLPPYLLRVAFMPSTWAI